ncbi:MAG: hypothetical protein Ct9H300mP28_12460 [Pseudomonadota bacterium]|nr:MAG: hypothetical protein Ct9H300mP28_12460 [Pseudomonadota bacterium]
MKPFESIPIIDIGEIDKAKGAKIEYLLSRKGKHMEK